MTLSLRAWPAGALVLAGSIFAIPAATSLPEPGITLRLEIFALGTSGPLAGARAELVPLGLAGPSALARTMTSDAAGRVEWSGLAPGRYRARVLQDGFAEAVADSLVLEAGRNLVLERVGLSPGAPLRAQVVDATGRAIEGAQVCVSSAAASGDPTGFRPTPLAGGSLCARSGADGAVVFSSLPFAQYRADVRAARYVPLEGDRVSHAASSGSPGWVLNPAGAIAGRLVDDAGNGVASAKVVVKDRLRGATANAKTNASGAFRADGLAPGRFRVEIEPPEHLSVLRDAVGVAPFETVDLGTLRTRPAAVLEGRVVGAGGAPLAGVEIRVRESEGARRVLRTAASDATGSFHLGGLPAAPVDLLAKPPQGWSARAFERLALPLSDALFELDGAVSLRGTVSVEDGTRAQGTRVSIFLRPDHPSYEAAGGQSVTSEVDPVTGEFAAEVPPGGELEVRAYAPGLREASAVVTAAAGRDVGPVELKLRPAGHSIKGEVRDRAGRPVAGARMSSAVTDAEGRFVLDSLEPGTLTFVVTHPRFAPLKHKLTVPSEEDQVVLVLDEGGIVEGTVMDAEGRPLAGVRVSADLPGLFAVTGAGGKYRIERVPEGESHISRQGAGAGGDYERRKVEIHSGETQRVDFRLGALVLDGTLTRAGLPVAGASVSIVQSPNSSKDERAPEESRAAQSTSDEDGQYRLAGMRPGPAVVTVTYGKQIVTKAIEVPAERGLPVDIALPEGTLEGVMLDPAGRPAAGACIAAPLVTENAEASTRTTTGPGGRFLLFVEAPGPETVRACVCGIGCQDLQVTSSEGPVTLWLSPRSSEEDSKAVQEPAR